jgi:hypothetical protein
MMKRLVAIALLAGGLAGAAQAETRNLTGFSEVNASDRIQVEVAVGDAFSVEVTGADADRVRTRIDGKVLRISDARRPWFGASRRLDATVHVTAPRIEGVAAARGAELSATLSGECDDFSAAAAMGGSARVSGMACRTVDAAAAMGGELRLAGACEALDVTAAMGGEVRAADLQCRTVDASAAMGGGVHAYASERFDASAAMGGDINVAGEARRGDTSAAMGGSIRQN